MARAAAHAATPTHSGRRHSGDRRGGAETRGDERSEGVRRVGGLNVNLCRHIFCGTSGRNRLSRLACAGAGDRLAQRLMAIAPSRRSRLLLGAVRCKLCLVRLLARREVLDAEA